ncbi:hypothetical protein G6F56_004681 [Rhizopus delemar]|uniref:FIT family protein scs3 n=1 Tax=Rhizopus stolonifer TaxID=4846 RepID=A0A367KUG1_RHIST|nr:hypothetical protein G6F56_004681 [Rhizopus delemar]RCI05797.1 hypothetical protein CU098_013012 [Rhizopus stolonifer]
MNIFNKYLKPHQQVPFILYPVTVLIAFTYSILGNPPETYFSNKRNILNVYFVKIGWFWVTFVYFYYLLLVRSKYARDNQQLIQGTLRYISVTLYWYIMTQWLLGPSAIDRIYILTGGRCNSLLQDVEASSKLVGVLEQQACRQLGGQWTGGHDVSGHCVLLIHASLFFWEELSWMFYSFSQFEQIKERSKIQYISILAVLGIAVIWWFMLFQTAVYFHGHYEILSGTFFGLLGWAVLVREDKFISTED